MVVVGRKDWYNYFESGGHEMKYLQGKATIIITVIMAILCLASISIAVRVATIDYRKKYQIVVNTTSQVQEEVQTEGKIVNIGRLKKADFYYNGEKVENIGSYIAEKNEFLLPVDEIFKNLDIKFSYFPFDDIFEALINGKKLTLRLGKDSFSYDGKEHTLSTAPLAAKDHILVPVELFSFIQGCIASGYEDRNAVFLNYFRDFEDNITAGIKLLRLQDDKAEISAPGKKIYWTSCNPQEIESGKKAIDEYVPSYNKEDYLLKSGSNTYLVSKKNPTEPVLINTDLFVTWASEGNYLFWTDSISKLSYIYDIEEGKVVEEGDYHYRISTVEKDFGNSGFSMLTRFLSGKNYKCITLRNWLTELSHTIIEKNGKVILSGRAEFSPDRKKVLFRQGNKFNVSNIDGSATVDLGEGHDAKWISNSRIQIMSEDEVWLVDSNGKNRVITDDEWSNVGKTADGSLIICGESALHIANDSNVSKISDFRGDCIYAFGASDQGPFIAVSKDYDSIYHISSSGTNVIGKYSQLLKRYQDGKTETDFDGSMLFSPDSSQLVLIQRDKGFVILKLIDSEGKMIKRLVLSNRITETSEFSHIQANWITHNRLLVYTPIQGWIMDFTKGVNIYEWKEDPGCRIVGAIVN